MKKLSKKSNHRLPAKKPQRVHFTKKPHLEGMGLPPEMVYPAKPQP